MRLIRNDEDEHLFQCLKDWPEDKQGKFTRARAQLTLREAMAQHLQIGYPLQEDSDWFGTLVIELSAEQNSAPIGVAHCRVLGRAVWVEWLALLPEHIGLGHFREIRLAWSWLTFEILQGDRLGFATRTDNAPTMAIMGMYDGEKSDKVRNRGLNTDAEKAKWWHSREDYLRNREAAFRDREGRVVVFRSV